MEQRKRTSLRKRKERESRKKLDGKNGKAQTIEASLAFWRNSSKDSEKRHIDAQEIIDKLFSDVNLNNGDQDEQFSIVSNYGGSHFEDPHEDFVDRNKRRKRPLNKRRDQIYSVLIHKDHTFKPESTEDDPSKDKKKRRPPQNQGHPQGLPPNASQSNAHQEAKPRNELLRALSHKLKDDVAKSSKRRQSK